jgi:ferredoxin-thioredoxin reductase catalytic subunit
MKIRSNPNKELVKEIREKLKENDGYCPCKIIKNKDTKCICKEFIEQGLGPCHCGLYIKEEI